MVSYKSAIDDFNDNSLDTSKWEVLVAGPTESSTVLNIPFTTSNPAIRFAQQRTCYDVSKGLLAIRLTRSGTASAAAVLKLGVRDSAGEYIMLTCPTNSTTFSIECSGGITVGSSVGVESPSLGFGSGWGNTDYFAVGNMGADNILHFYRSANGGLSWIEIAKTTLVTGTFDKVKAGLRMVGNLTTGTSTFVAQMDDASYFSIEMTQFVIDNFADNSFDSTLWDNGGSSTGISETGGKLVFSPVAASAKPFVTGIRKNNMKRGIVAVRLSKTGTTNTDVYTYVGIKDDAGHTYILYGKTNAATFVFDSTGAAMNVNVTTTVDTTVGFGPSWTANDYIGFSYSEIDSVMRILKSNDNGVTWSELVRVTFTAGGTFNWNKVSMFFGGANLSAGTSSMVFSYDDASYFAHTQYLRNKVRVGSNQYMYALPRVRVGGAWQLARARNRVSSAWVYGN
jgi:hypothetical protein